MSCFMTTGYNFEGYRITQYCGIITAHAIMPTMVLNEAKKWDPIRQSVYKDLEQHLPEGANAIIGIQVEHNQSSPAHVYLFVTGTAVTVEQIL